MIYGIQFFHSIHQPTYLFQRKYSLRNSRHCSWMPSPKSASPRSGRFKTTLLAAPYGGPRFDFTIRSENGGRNFFFCTFLQISRSSWKIKTSNKNQNNCVLYRHRWVFSLGLPEVGGILGERKMPPKICFYFFWGTVSKGDKARWGIGV